VNPATICLVEVAATMPRWWRGGAGGTDFFLKKLNMKI
jgi:hypothetical protein